VLTAIVGASSSLGAGMRIVRTLDADAAAAVDAACVDSASPACTAALDELAVQVAARLREAASRSSADLREVARLAADSSYAPLRAAGAAALAAPYATAAETPWLAELADDPVPAVRLAALRALRGSNDERAQRLARRADAFGQRGAAAEGESESPDAAPAAERMGVPLPAGAVFLHFASDPAGGRYAWHTREPVDRVLAALRGKGKGPLTPEEFHAQAQPLSGGSAGMPSADDMQRAMAMAEQMMRAMEGAQGKSPEEQAAAVQNATRGMASRDQDLASVYERTELFTDPRLTIVPLPGGGEVVVAVFADPVVGGTGITLHRAPLEAP
jgi:hypothetical protein